MSRPLLYGSPHKPDWGPLPDGAPEGCEVTTDRRRLPEADAVVLSVAEFRWAPTIPKYPGQRWVARFAESAVHYRWLADPRYLRLFEVTVSYRRDATIWEPYIEPGLVAALSTPSRAKTNAAAAVYLQSSGVDASGRLEYVRELMKRVRVASFGRVLNNQGGARIGRSREEKLALIGRYRFTLAFENAREVDSVTEKLYDPLVVGSVPVYLGAPNVRDLAPAERCFIDTADFSGPGELAAYLNRLLVDERAYEEYLAWKGRGAEARFRAMAAQVERPWLERLCDHLGGTIDPARPVGGRPSYPLRPPWHRRALRRVARALAVIRRRGERPGAGGPGTGRRGPRP